MKNLFCIGIALLLTAGTVPAVDATRTSHGSDLEPIYTMALLNTWELTWASSLNYLLGLDYEETSGIVSAVNPHQDSLFYFSASDPTVLLGLLDLPVSIEWPQDIATTGSGSGEYMYLIDSNYEGKYYCYHNGVWSSYTGNPASEYGMGLAIDESGYLWESAWQGNIFRFAPGSGTHQHFILQITDVYPQGLALFSYEGQTGVAIGYRLNKLVEFYVFTPPSSWVFLGSASVPGTFDYCHGLEYISDRDTFYMLVKASNKHYIIELGCDILELQSDTWGSIKTMF